MLARRAAAKAARNGRASYGPVTGTTPKHHQALIDGRHTNPKSIPLTEKGCPGKPEDLEFINTSPQTGMVTANTAKEVTQAKQLGYFVVEEGRTARRIVRRGNDYVHEDMTVPPSFWKLEKGLVIDPATRKPAVGDYDLMGVIDPKAPGRDIGLVASDGGLVTDVTNPLVKRAAAVNGKIEIDRVLHGAQDMYEGFRKGASAYHPDGTVRHFPTEDGVKAYYESIGRQTRAGRYGGDGPVVPPRREPTPLTCGW